jgi:hypothetical protein
MKIQDQIELGPISPTVLDRCERGMGPALEVPRRL